MTIAELIKVPEGKSIEFKRDASPLKRIARTVVAFANTAGGSLFIGIEDSGNTGLLPEPSENLGSWKNGEVDIRG